MQDPVVVVGLGRSGIGAARLLNARGADVWLLESNTSPELKQRADALSATGIQVELGKPLALESFEALPRWPSVVVVSPGIAFDHPVLNQLRDRGCSVVGEVELAWDAMASIPWVGITGTNGKTTVTSLVAHLLQQGGLDAPACGNIGASAAELALACLEGEQPERVVVELSSYQIEAAPSVQPSIGVWTTLTPDHLDRHGTLERYRSIKAGLLQQSRRQFLNADDRDLYAHAAEWPQALWVSGGDKEQFSAAMTPHLWVSGGQLCNQDGPLFPCDALAMPGAHNRQNLALATAVALECGLSPSQIEAGCRSFPGVPHRLERIRELGGITYYNDSKATNYDASLVALQSLERPLVVLAGGRAKRGEPGAWLEALRQKAAAVVLFGEARSTFCELLGSAGYPGVIEQQEHLDQALPLARQLAEQLNCQAVLLSPACASFDQYRDFEVRGDHFRQLVEAMA
ncbi:MAG: UDP-N-acetylmuramoyl-L-alanine--D-glutamate ligase [Synechococcus sp.]